MLIAWNMDHCEIPPQGFLLEVQYPGVVDVIQLLVPKDLQQGLVIHAQNQLVTADREVLSLVEAPRC